MSSYGKNFKRLAIAVDFAFSGRSADGTGGPSWAEAVQVEGPIIADGGYRGTGLLIPHRRECGQTELPAWKEEHNTSHRKVRARVEYVLARMKAWKNLRGCA